MAITLGAHSQVWFNGTKISDNAVVQIPVVVKLDPIKEVCALIASAGPIDGRLGTSPMDILHSVTAAVFQDDDAHDTCTLTACLNPLHPGPCKGWKHTLFKTAPHAWHALEATKVEKANANRLKKIQALKDAGQPIPKKLLQPIVAKPHPHAGKTANAATGEAHAAGKAVSEASGVHVNEPGKVTLGQAVKTIKATDATNEKGAKGKKPTVASKGIAAVIAQEKVTPTYKLTKAEAITPEQWSALSHDEKAIIRGELTKIENEGFGPQQKKATELLAKLTIAPNAPTAVAVAKTEATVLPKLGDLTPGTPGTITTPSGKTYQKVTPSLAPLPNTATPLKTTALLKQHGSLDIVINKGSDYEKSFKDVGLKGDHEHLLVNKGKGNWYITGKDGQETFVSKQQPLHLSPAKPSDKHPEVKAPTEDEAVKAIQDAANAPSKPKITIMHEVKEPVTSKTQAAAIVAISNAIPGVKNMDPATADKLAESFDTLKAKSELKTSLPFIKAVNALANKALATATEDKMPGLGHGDHDAHIGTFHKEISDHILNGEKGLPPLVAKMVKNHESVLAGKGPLKSDAEIAKAKAAQDEMVKAMVEAHQASPPKVQTMQAVTHMTPSGLAKQIQKNGPTKVTVKGITHKVGFENAPDDHAKLVQVTGIGTGTGHYVLKLPNGESIHLGKGEQISVHPHEAEKPAKLSEVATPDTAVHTSAPVPKEEKPKPLPKHVQHAIDMSQGKAPGASWSKNHLLAYQPLSGEEFNALPSEVQVKIIQDLKKAGTKLLDPKKLEATKATLEKFKAALIHGKAHAPEAPTVNDNLHDHSVAEAKAKAVAESTSAMGTWLAVKEAAGLEPTDNPDAGPLKKAALDVADDLLKLRTKGYGPDVLKQPAVVKAMEEFQAIAEKNLYAISVKQAKEKAYNKVSQKLYADGHPDVAVKLSPIEKAFLQKYQKHLLEHPVDTSQSTMDGLLSESTQKTKALDDALHDAQAKLNTPKIQVNSASPAVQGPAPVVVASNAVKLLGPEATHPKVNLTMAEIKEATTAGKTHAENLLKSNFPNVDATEPAVAAKIKNLGLAAGQLEATKASKAKLDKHFLQHHAAAIDAGVSPVTGHPLTAEDKKTIFAHVQQLKDEHNYLQTVKAEQEPKVAKAEQELLDAAKAAGNAPPPAATEISDYDANLIDHAYQNAWDKVASKAVTFGVKYPNSYKMKEHAEYQQLTYDLGNLKALSGKVALAHAKQHTAELNVPTDPDTGAKLDGPEKKAWLQAAKDQIQASDEFNKLHKTTQARLDKIRADLGLNKRALPKADNAAVKAAAAESGYYKTAQYSGPNYGKHHKAKHYMVAKVGPKHAIVHQTASEKAEAKATADTTIVKKLEQAKAAQKKASSNIPSASEAGTTPNEAAALKHGFQYVPATASDGTQWPGSGAKAYIANPDHYAEAQALVSSPDTKRGLEAQKEFTWSINNMEGKGGSPAAKKALYYYTGEGSSPINNKLNSLPAGSQKTGSSTITNIDNGMTQAPPTNGDLILYRGFSSPHSVFSSGKWNDVNVAGMEWSQRSYSSTSGELSTAQSFAGYNGVVMRIIIPKEMQIKGINAKGGQHPGENEVILRRGLRYRVVADYGTSGSRRYIDVMVVPNPYETE